MHKTIKDLFIFLIIFYMNEALLSDAIAITVSSMFETTTTATYVESTAGIAKGGQTGLTSLVVGILFFTIPIL